MKGVFKYGFCFINFETNYMLKNIYALSCSIID